MSVEAEERGYAARLAEASTDDNPYDGETQPQLADAWLTGWVVAQRQSETKARYIERKAREYALAIYCLRAAAAPVHKPIDAKKTYAAALVAGRGLAECEAEAEAEAEVE